MKSPAILLIGAEDEENLAIRTLAAFLRQQSTRADVVGFSHESDTPQVLQAIRRLRPEIVAISLAFQCLARMYFRLVECIREAGFTGHVVVGGYFATLNSSRACTATLERFTAASTRSSSSVAPRASHANWTTCTIGRMRACSSSMTITLCLYCGTNLGPGSSAERQPWDGSNRHEQAQVLVSVQSSA